MKDKLKGLQKVSGGSHRHSIDVDAKLDKHTNHEKPETDPQPETRKKRKHSEISKPAKDKKRKRVDNAVAQEPEPKDTVQIAFTPINSPSKKSAVNGEAVSENDKVETKEERRKRKEEKAKRREERVKAEEEKAKRKAERAKRREEKEKRKQEKAKTTTDAENVKHKDADDSIATDDYKRQSKKPKKSSRETVDKHQKVDALSGTATETKPIVGIEENSLEVPDQMNEIKPPQATNRKRKRPGLSAERIQDSSAEEETGDIIEKPTETPEKKKKGVETPASKPRDIAVSGRAFTEAEDVQLRRIVKSYQKVVFELEYH
jgi:hypothetical protein